MADPKELARQFLAALSANEAAQYEAVLSDDAALRLGRWDGSEIYRPRWRVIQRFMDEWSAWPDPKLETLTIMSDGDKAAIEFRIQATENDRYVEHTRSAFLTIKDDQHQHHRSVLQRAGAQRAAQRLDRSGDADGSRTSSPVRIADEQR